MVAELSQLAAIIGLGGAVLIVAATIFGGTAQGSTGFGASYVTVPAIAIVAPQLLPGTMLMAALPLTIAMAFIERRSLDREAVVRLLVARIPGIAVGTTIVIIIDIRWLTLVIGVVLLTAVAASALGLRIRVTPRREIVAGALSGVTGSAMALGGLPLVVLYRDRDPAVVRPTLSVVWAGGILLTLITLGVAGRFTPTHALIGLALSLVLLVGLAISRVIVAKISPLVLRIVVLSWAAIGGLGAIVRSLAGT